MRWTVFLAFTVLAGALGYLAIRFLLPLLIPFLIAWMISLAIVPAARRVADRFHLPRKVCAIVFLLLFFGGAVFLLWVCVKRLTGEVRALFESIMTRYGSIEGMLQAWEASMEGFLSSLGWMGEGAKETILSTLYRALGGLLSAIATRLPEWIGTLFSALPSFFLGAVVTVVAGFYFCMDRDALMKGLVDCLPTRMRQGIPSFRARMRRVSWRYLRAYLLLLLVTLVILFIGFLWLRIPYALLLACLIALLDMLPVFGVGTVLFPWAGVLLLQKSYYRGFGLLILYCVAALTRQVAEPRLIGKSLGLHPLLTVFVTYAGFSLFGILGMIFAPFLALLARFFLSHERREAEEVKK